MGSASDLGYASSMASLRPCIALIAAVWLCAFPAFAEARRVVLQDGRATPVPPEPAYHPVPGPYLAGVDDRGSLNDAGVVANATESWGGPRLSAFILCFQPGVGPVDWNVVFAALNDASRKLAARGAVVVVDARRLCPSPANPSMKGKPHVEIKGVLRSPG